jgi:hypothetical protein
MEKLNLIQMFMKLIQRFFEDFVSSSISKLIFEGNNNGFIISRIYNGI